MPGEGDATVPEGALRARLVQLEELIDALAGAETVPEVAAVVARLGARLLGAAGGLVALLDEAGTTMEVAAAVGYPPGFLETWNRVDLDAPLLVAEVVRTQRPVALPVVVPPHDPAAPTAGAGIGGPPHQWPPDVTAAGYRAFVAVPMLISGRVLGSLALGFTDAHAFSAADEQFMVTVAGQCALSLERTRLFEAERAAREAEVAARER